MAASTESRLNKKLYTDITRLKLLDEDNADPRFRLLETPFTGDQEKDQLKAKTTDDLVIIGQIFPKSEIYKERSYKIEIILPKTFPTEPPKVKFLTPLYHPNVEESGIFCTELLQKTHNWTPGTPLAEVLKAVTKHIDEPDIDYASRANVGKEYQENRAEFNRKALEYVLKHGLPR